MHAFRSPHDAAPPGSDPASSASTRAWAALSPTVVAALGLHDLDDVVEQSDRALASGPGPAIRLVPAVVDPPSPPPSAPPASAVAPASEVEPAPVVVPESMSAGDREPAPSSRPAAITTTIPADDEVAALAELFGTTKAPVGLRSVPERGADEDGADDLEVRRLAEFFSRG